MNLIFATIISLLKLVRTCRSFLVGMISVVVDASRRLDILTASLDSIVSGLQQVRSGLVKICEIEKMQIGLRLFFLGELREGVLRRAYATVPVRTNRKNSVRSWSGYSSPNNSFRQRSLDLGRFSDGWDHPLD